MSYLPFITHRISSNTAGATASVYSGSYVLAGGNNITLSQNANTVTISGANQSNQTLGAYAVSNTTQSSSGTIDARSLSFNGAGIASVGVTNGSVVISVPAGGGAAGTNTLGMSNLGNTSGTTGTVTGSNIQFIWAGGNNVTLSQSLNGSSGTITISAASQSNQSGNIYFVGNTTGQSSSSTYDARTLSFDGAGIVSAGWSAGSIRVSATQSNQALSGSNGSFAFQTATFGNLNGLSFYTSNGSMVGSYTVPNQSNQTIGAYAVSNTTQSSSGTIDARSLSFNGAGIASVGITNGSVVISVPAGGGAGDGYNIIAAGTQTANTTGTVVFSNSNGVTFGMSNNSVVTASVNGPTTLSYYDPFDDVELVAGQHGQSSLHIQPMEFVNVQHDRFIMPILFTGATNSTGSYTITYDVGLYSRNGSSLSLISSVSASTGITHSGTANSTLNSGSRIVSFGWTNTVTEGQYWVGMLSRTTSAGANATISNFLCTFGNSVFSGYMGSATSATIQRKLGLGYYSAQTAAVPSSIAFSQINGTNSLAPRLPPIWFLSVSA